MKVRGFDQDTSDKIIYWQTMSREASAKGIQIREDYFDYYDKGYFLAWQERSALCYRRIVSLRGF